jgi:aflatoxin B1 aldehyde reductase
MSRPSTLFGGALIGTSFTTAAQVQELLDQLQSIGINRIDTAARYSPTSPGSSERLLGEVRAQEQGFTIDTKTSTDGSLKTDGSESLTAANITKSINDSFSRLHVDNVHILYFHRPDPETPISEQAGEIHRHYLEGRFEKVGHLYFISSVHVIVQILMINDLI